jgi:hypothetical protein
MWKPRNSLQMPVQRRSGKCRFQSVKAISVLWDFDVACYTLDDISEVLTVSIFRDMSHRPVDGDSKHF